MTVGRLVAIVAGFLGCALCCAGCTGRARPDSPLDGRIERMTLEGSLKEILQYAETQYKLKIQCDVGSEVLNSEVCVGGHDVPVKNALWLAVRVADPNCGVEIVSPEQGRVRVAGRRELAAPWMITEDEAANRRIADMLDRTRVKVDWVESSPLDCLIELFALAGMEDPKLGVAINLKTREALSRAARVTSGAKELSLGEAIRSILKERGFTLQVIGGFMLVEQAPQPAPR